MSVELHINHHQLVATPGRTIFAHAESCGVPVPTSCRKQGKCKECLVEVVEGMEFLSPKVKAEAPLRGNFRLSCCAEVLEATGTVRCHTLRRGQMRVETTAMQLPVRHPEWQPDPAVTREGDRILMDGEEIDRREGPIHGLAMDLGTTTVVLRLLNLETGEIVADASFENPQRFGGSDVMARIQYDTEDGTFQLQRTLTAYLAKAIQDFPVDPASIYEMTVAGNSTMRDLFFKLDVHPIGQNPFQSITELEVASGKRSGTAVVEQARRLHLPLNPRARVYGLPIISGHVGADAAACMLAVNLAHEDRLVVIMDIGTNTELIVGNRHQILAASCPAGPAFEGGRIASGMPGLPGAIERVRLRPDGTFEFEVIGNGDPEGICGSGLVDLLGALLQGGLINPLGRMRNGRKEILLSEVGGEHVIFSEADINELAQAKGAHAAGLQILFDTLGKRFTDVEVFYIAGGFGRYLDLDASRHIGLIPNLDRSRFVQVGNASVEGASLVLLSRSKRAELETMVRQVTHCRLETHPSFFDFFVDGCQFRPLEVAP